MDRALSKILGFFDLAVLAPYHEQPEKYEITSDYFEGCVTIKSEYYAQLVDDAAQASRIFSEAGRRGSPASSGRATFRRLS